MVYNIPNERKKGRHITMAEENKTNNGEEMVETDVFTLTDENGVESDFELLLSLEIEGETYYALIPANEEDDDEGGEYVILKLATEDGEEMLVTIDDDEEFDKISAIFDDALFGETDHDE